MPSYSTNYHSDGVPDYFRHIFDRFLKVRRLKETSWKALCPVHVDREPSMGIMITKRGYLYFRCFANKGCSSKQIIESYGIHPSELYPPHLRNNKRGNKQKASRKKIVKTYWYRGPMGDNRYQTVRYEPKDFRQRRLAFPGERSDDGWVWSVDGVELVPYRLPEIIEHLDDPRRRDEPIYIMEGEKDCDLAWEHGITATCNAMGAGKWWDAYSVWLKGANVVMAADLDDADPVTGQRPGTLHGEQVCESLAGLARSVRWLEWTDGAKDFSDWWVRVDYSRRADLRLLAADSPTWFPMCGHLDRVSREVLSGTFVGGKCVHAAKVRSRVDEVLKDFIGLSANGPDDYYDRLAALTRKLVIAMRVMKPT